MRARMGTFDGNRARVSFVVLQKSKSWVWHRGSASSAKSGAGVHGCLGRCRSHRLTTGANAAIEGTQGRVLVAAKPQHPPSSLMKQPQGLRGCGAGTRARGREKARFDGRRLGSWTRRTFTGFRRNGLGSVGRSSQQLPQARRSGDSRRVDRGVRGSVGQATRGRKHLVIGATQSVSARSRVVKRGAAR